MQRGIVISIRLSVCQTREL